LCPSNRNVLFPQQPEHLAQYDEFDKVEKLVRLSATKQIPVDPWEALTTLEKARSLLLRHHAAVARRQAEDSGSPRRSTTMSPFQ